MKTRNFKIDNLKGFLIILVVFGHLLELIMNQGAVKYIYEWIYSFHMPLFVFLSGYFYKYSFKKIVQKLLCPYVIFQTIYVLFARYILESGETLQYHKPYWLLWYLLGMVAWSLITPLFPKGNLKKEIVSLLFTLTIAVTAGFCNEIDRDYSLSRILVFLPFFLLGYFFHMWENRSKDNILLKGRGKLTLEVICLAVITIFSIGLFFVYDRMKNSWFYEAVSYQASESTIWFRLIHITIAVCFILVFMCFMTNKSMGLITRIGEKTLPIFLLHGFGVKLMAKYHFFDGFRCKIFGIIVVTVIIVYVCSFDWIDQLIKIWKRKNPKPHNEISQED